MSEAADSNHESTEQGVSGGASAESIAPEPPASASDDATGGAQLSKPTRRMPVSARGVLILTLAAAAVAIGSYLAVSGSPGGQSASGRLSGNVLNPAQGASVTTAGAVAPPGPMPGAPAGHQSPATDPASSPAKMQNVPKPLRPSDPAQVKSWNSGQAGAALARVTSQAGAVLMAHGSGQYTQMLQACEALSGAVKTAEALPPVPDAAMQNIYSKSLAAFKAGIVKCEAGITQHPEGVEDTVTHVNPSDIQQAVKQFGTGMTDLYIATEVLRKQ